MVVEQPLGGQRRRDLEFPLAAVVGLIVTAVDHRHAAALDVVDENIEPAEPSLDGRRQGRHRLPGAQVDRHGHEGKAPPLKLLRHLPGGLRPVMDREDQCGPFLAEASGDGPPDRPRGPGDESDPAV